MSSIGSLLVAQGSWDTNWFTTTWLISAGTLVGCLLVLLYLLKVWVVSRIPGLNRVGESRVGLMVAGLLSSLVLGGLIIGYIIWVRGWDKVSGPLVSGSADQRGDGYLTILFPALYALIAGFGFWLEVSARRVDAALGSAREGFLKWLGWICLGLSVFAVTGYLLGKVDGFGIIRLAHNPDELLQSLARLPASGIRTLRLTVPPTESTDPGMEVAVDFPGPELRAIEVSSNQALEISSQPLNGNVPSSQMYRISPTSADRPETFRRSAAIPDGQVTRLYVANRGRNPATATIRYALVPVYYPEILALIVPAVSVAGLYTLLMGWSVLFPKIAAISLATFKSEVSQPVYFLVIAAGVCFITVSIFLPYNTFGEDIKMYKDSGVTLIRVLAIFVAIWAASKSVAEEIDGRTALTVLSKPVGRRQFILGKIAGISQVIGLLFIVLGLWFVFWTSYKPVYDAVETSKGATEWAECFREATSVVPALLLGFFESVLFVIISVMISTRLGILPNLVICFSIYILGHITPLLVMSSAVVSNFEPVVFFGRLIAIIFPVLDSYSVEAAFMTNEGVPVPYQLACLLYTLLYGAVGVLLALVLFEDRDLA